MKNKFFACFTAALFIWTITGIAYTQRLSGMANNDPDCYRDQTPLEYMIPVPEQLTPSNRPGFFYRNDINIKAVRNFLKEFKNVAAVKWFKENNGSAVHFTMDGFTTKVYYDKKGNYQSRISIYSETQLPRDVRHLVKSKYYDQNITQILNVKQDNRNFWLIRLEDAKTYIRVRVENMELEETQRFQKSK